MKRWAAVAAALSLLSVSGCDWGGEKSASRSSLGADPGISSQSQVPPPDAAAGVPTDGLSAIARQMKGSAFAPSDDAAAASGRRLFDGQGGSGALAYADDAVVAAPYPGARPRPRVVYTSLHSRTPSDLRTPPPPPAYGGFLSGAPGYPGASAAVSRGADQVLAAFDGFQHKMFDTFAPIVSRAGWHAARRLGTSTPMTPARVTVHHTEGEQTMTEAATEAAVRNIQHYHMAGRAAEGKDTWDDIGYHYLIDGAGRVVEGRPADTLGAHARGANGDNVGIAMMGNFDKVKPTAAQTESLTRLVSFLALKYGRSPREAGFLEGHQHYDQTSCPGRNMMAILSALRLRVDGETAALAARMKTAAPGQFVAAATTNI